ncbi:MAG: bis(5'-nucleosyl)-tetraphosphatase [Candidatus Izemoplasmatales bacterium]
MKYEKSCGAVVYTVDDENQIKYLLILMNHGHYSFPKGHMEENEDEWMTARREIKEETGIDVNFVGNFRKIVTYSPYPNTMKDVVFFLAKALHTEIKIQAEELQSAAFVTKEQVDELLTFDTDKEVFLSAISYLDTL